MKTQHIVAAVAITLLHLPSLAAADGSPDHTSHPPKPVTDANITGHVRNATTQEHLPYISITVKGTTLGTTTDATGHYMLKNLPAGDLVLEASMLGYKTEEKKVTTQADKLLEVNFDLEEDAVALDEVVVSATRNETSKKEAPIIVNVSSTKLFEGTSSATLAEGMNFQPGLRVENNCGNCGTTQLRINGLEGQYSQILIDSRPVFSSLAGVYGLEQLPVSMIERVEVIRGGGSALYGSSAIGGVMNIITKEPLRNFASLANTTSVLPGGKTDINTSLNASLVSDDRKAGVYLFGMLKNRDWYDRNGDGFSDIPEINAQTLGFRGYYRTGDRSRLSAEYHHIHEFRRGGNLFDRPPHEADIAEQLDHEIDGGGLRFNTFSPNYKHRWEIFASGQGIRRASYYGAQKNPDAYGHTNDKTFAIGTQYTYTMDRLWFMPAELTAGIEYNYNDLHDYYMSLDRDFTQQTHVTGGYLQNEWKTEKLSLLVGARLDKHNLMEHVVLCPRANIRYSPSEQVGLRVSYSSGYRAPQAYNEDLHIEAVGGALALIRLAKGLKPEYSHSVSASADLYHSFGRLQANLLVEGFYTMLNNVFTLVRIGENEDGSIVYWERRNGSGATVAGVNFEGKIGIPHRFELQLGYTLQSSRYDTPERWSDQLAPQRKMFRAPDHYGYLTSLFDITPRFKASLFGTYTGSMLVKHILSDGTNETDLEQNTPSFWDMGIKLAYTFRIGKAVNLEVNTGVKNIFDAYQKDLDYGAFKDADYVYGPSLPRMYFVGIKFSI